MKQKTTFQTIFLILAFLLLIMPAITTFNEFLTRIVEKIELYKAIQDKVVPYEAKMIASLLSFLGIKSWSVSDDVFMLKGLGKISYYISWNCIGWQSLILMMVTFLVGLQGSFTFPSKIETVLIGLLGTFLINIGRLTLIFLFAYFTNPFAATIFHDYGSTLMIIAWLFLFWWLSYTFVLQPTKS